jgi:transcriptional regulator with XRE-family HTH domain
MSVEIGTAAPEAEQARAFAAWLRTERERRGLSINQLSSRSGISYSAMRQYEAGTRMSHGRPIPASPSNKALYGIAQGLDLPPEIVFSAAGRGDRYQPQQPAVESYYERLEALEEQARAVYEAVRALRRTRG